MSESIAELKVQDPVATDVENDIGLNGSSQTMSELTGYLAKLGLGEEHLAKVISLMQATGGEAIPAEVLGETSTDAQPEPDIQSFTTNEINNASGVTPDGFDSRQTGWVTVFLAEEQQILLQAFKTFFEGQETINLLGSSADTSSEALVQAAQQMCPKVMLLEVKALRPSTVEILESLRDACPDVGIVLLFAFYDAQGIGALREYSRDVSVGRAYLLKHTIDMVDQLTHAISSVAEGRMIVDPEMMEDLVDSATMESQLLLALSPKEMQVLSWIARGFANKTIPSVLSRDTKAVERQVSNIYTKLHLSDQGKTPELAPPWST